jgi:hypothetical protein
MLHVLFPRCFARSCSVFCMSAWRQESDEVVHASVGRMVKIDRFTAPETGCHSVGCTRECGLHNSNACPFSCHYLRQLLLCTSLSGRAIQNRWRQVLVRNAPSNPQRHFVTSRKTSLFHFLRISRYHVCRPSPPSPVRAGSTTKHRDSRKSLLLTAVVLTPVVLSVQVYGAPV